MAYQQTVLSWEVLHVFSQLMKADLQGGSPAVYTFHVIDQGSDGA